MVYFLINPRSTVPTMSTSGAISGVMGAYIVMFLAARFIIFIIIKKSHAYHPHYID